jgi:hypothetical protein
LRSSLEQARPGMWIWDEFVGWESFVECIWDFYNPKSYK